MSLKMCMRARTKWQLVAHSMQRANRPLAGSPAAVDVNPRHTIEAQPSKAWLHWVRTRGSQYMLVVMQGDVLVVAAHLGLQRRAQNTLLGTRELLPKLEHNTHARCSARERP